VAGQGWRMGVVNLAVWACVLRETTKKGRQLFEEKVHPRENPGYAYAMWWMNGEMPRSNSELRRLTDADIWSATGNKPYSGVWESCSCTDQWVMHTDQLTSLADNGLVQLQLAKRRGDDRTRQINNQSIKYKLISNSSFRRSPQCANGGSAPDM